MATDNEVDVILTASVDPSVARAFKQFLSEVSSTSGEAKKIIADWSKFATSVAIQVANTESVVTKEQVKQFAQGVKEKTQYEKAFTSGVQKEIKARVASYNAADKERLQFFKSSQTQALNEMASSEKEMIRLHLEAIKENERIDREYWKNRERIAIEGQKILAQMTKDQNAYLNPATPTGGGVSSLMAMGASSLLRQFLPVMVAYRTARAALNFTENSISSGVKLADDTRDVDSAIKAYSTSALQAAKSQDFFTRAMETSRQTALELKKMYVDILPKGLSAHLSEDTIRKVTLDLSYISNLHPDQDPKDLSKSTAALLGGGRLVGGSPLSRAIGLTPEQLTAMKATGADWRKVIIDLLDSVAEEGKKVGKSLDATWEQTKFSMLDNFATGFNKARGSALTGMEGIRKAILDPALLIGLQYIGTAVAKTIELLSMGAKNNVNLIMLFVDGLKLEFSTLLVALSSAYDLIIKIGSKTSHLVPDSVSIATTGLSHKQWDEAKADADGFAAYWKKVFSNTTDDIKNRIVDSAKTTYNTYKNLFNIDPGKNPNIKPGSTDDPEGEAF